MKLYLYEHILSYVASTPWAMLETKMQEFLSVLAFRASGNRFTADEIQARIGTPAEQPPASVKRGSVAVLPLRGTIAHRMGSMDESSGGMSAERFTLMFRALVADESIGTIVLDVDSPGGTLPGIPEAAAEVFAARDKKQIIAVANSHMASAAYWIASQAHEIVAIPSVMDMAIGSIGVFCVHEDLTAALEKEGRKITIIRAGKNKARGSPFETLSEERLAELQATADYAKGQFVKGVAEARNLSSADVVTRYGDGAAFSAKDAKAAGLIDRIATMDDVIGKLVGRKTSAGMRAEDEAAELVASLPQADGDDGQDDLRRRRLL